MSSASVVSGPAGILISASGDDGEGNEGDDDEEEDEGEEIDSPDKDKVLRSALEATAVAPPSAGAQDWTFRAFDVGPTSMQLLGDYLCQPSTSHNTVIVNGLSGAVEFDAFSESARQLVAILRELTGGERAPCSLLIAGRTTAEWLQWLETPVSISAKTRVAEPSPSRLVDSGVLRNAPALKELLASKPHSIVAQFMEEVENV